MKLRHLYDIIANRNTHTSVHAAVAALSVWRIRAGWRYKLKKEDIVMSVVSMKQLLEAGVHFGHQTRRWNPKMSEYIFTERNGIHIIDLQKTVKKIEEAYMFVRDTAAAGGTVLFVGTKKAGAGFYPR